MRSFAPSTGGGLGAGVGLGPPAGGGLGRTRLKTAGGGRKTSSCRSKVDGSISSILFGVTGGRLIRTMSMTEWTMAETRNPWR